jgi:hypothetical protein
MEPIVYVNSSYLLGLTACFILVSCSVYSLTLKLEVMCSLEMLLDFQWTAWCYTPEGRILCINTDVTTADPTHCMLQSALCLKGL